MRNTICENKFYKSKSIMIVGHSVSVNYGVGENYIEFKFATRADSKSPGNWDDNNRFFISGYVALYNLVKGMEAVIKKKLDKYQINNPMKKTGLIFRVNVGDDGTKWAVFHFFGENEKISTSLHFKDEFLGLYKYLSSILDNFHVISAIALYRNDFYFKNFGNKNNDNDSGSSKNRPNNKSNNKPKKEVINDDISDDADVDSLIDDMPDFGDDDIPF